LIWRQREELTRGGREGERSWVEVDRRLSYEFASQRTRKRIHRVYTIILMGRGGGSEGFAVVEVVGVDVIEVILDEMRDKGRRCRVQRAHRCNEDIKVISQLI